MPASRRIPRLVPKPAIISNSFFDDERTLDEEMQDMNVEDVDGNLGDATSTTGQNSKIMNA